MTNTTHDMHTSHMRLYNDAHQRLYLNADERTRFIDCATRQENYISAFCLTLLYTGCRLSEARELTTESFVSGEQRLVVRSLKKRNQHHIREIPVPASLVQSLISLRVSKESYTSNQWLWANEAGGMIDRITAYRWVKMVMREAGIHGPQACPKGLRHSYAIHAIRCGIQLNMIQKWMGHADIKTTAIYANAVGAEELELAGKMW